MLCEKELNTSNMWSHCQGKEHKKQVEWKKQVEDLLKKLPYDFCGNPDDSMTCVPSGNTSKYRVVKRCDDRYDDRDRRSRCEDYDRRPPPSRYDAYDRRPTPRDNRYDDYRRDERRRDDRYDDYRREERRRDDRYDDYRRRDDRYNDYRRDDRDRRSRYEDYDRRPPPSRYDDYDRDRRRTSPPRGKDEYDRDRRRTSPPRGERSSSGCTADTTYVGFQWPHISCISSTSAGSVSP